MRIEPSFGGGTGRTAAPPAASSASSRASSPSISASTTPTRAPRARSASRIAMRSRWSDSISGDQPPYGSFDPSTSAPEARSRSNTSARPVSIVTCSGCGRPPQNGCGPDAFTSAGWATRVARSASIGPVATRCRKRCRVASSSAPAASGVAAISGREARAAARRSTCAFMARQLVKPCSRATASCASASRAAGRAARRPFRRSLAVLRSHSRLARSGSEDMTHLLSRAPGVRVSRAERRRSRWRDRRVRPCARTACSLMSSRS